MMFSEEVLEERTLLVRGKPLEQLLIKWHDLVAERSSWEEKETLLRLFPSINLEVKDDPMKSGNDRDASRKEVREEAHWLVHALEDASAEQTDVSEEGEANDHPATTLGRNLSDCRVLYPNTHLKDYIT